MRALLALLILVVPWAARGSGFDAEVLTLTRALAYDRALATRAGDELRVAVVSDPERLESVELARGVREALDELAPLTVQDLPVDVIELAGQSTEVAGVLRENDVDVIYLCTSGDPTGLMSVANTLGVVVLSFDEDSVVEGAHVGVVEHRDGLRLLVNLPASRAAGLDFSSRLLQVSRVIR